MKRTVRAVLAIILGLSISNIAFAQEKFDEDYPNFDGEKEGAFSAAAEFLSPQFIVSDEAYDFEFRIENTSTSGADANNWICEVDLFMPSSNYTLNEDIIANPDALHSGEWTHEIDQNDNRDLIMWMHSGLNATSSSLCDIREGEALEFSFRADTGEGPDDGFDWSVQSFAGEWDTGTAYINGSNDDDDDSGDDDVDLVDDDTDGANNYAHGSDTSDDSDSGCGC